MPIYAATLETHVQVKQPEIDARHLADYMAGSERKKRAILVGCKYRPIAKLTTDDFDALTNEANADYIKRFSFGRRHN